MTEYNFGTLANRLRELAFLNSGLVINLEDERNGGQKERYEYKGGIKEFVSLLSQAKEPVHDDVVALLGEFPSSEGKAPVTVDLAPFVPRTAEDLGVTEQLAQAREAVIGSWHGIVKTPWTEPYQIVASFDWEGGYTARCEQNSDVDTDGCCRAFYYGSDRNSPFKHWSLTSVNADHSIDGEIDIMFCDADGRCSAPAWQGELRKLEYDETGNRIRFQFWRSDGYGPLEIDLERD
jgi:hypothetical protein